MATTTTPITPTTSTPSITRVDNLPATTVQCHASNLLELPNKTLLCAWFGGTQEGTSDISIYLSRLPFPSTTISSTASTWTEPIRISRDKHRSEQNPVLFRDPVSGTIWLFHTAQPLGNQDEAVVVARTSSREDEGRTWSEPFLPFHDKKGVFVRQPVVVLPDGTWVLPIWHCRITPGFRWVGNDDVSAVMYSRDAGKTWLEKSVPDSRGCVHMNIVAPPPSFSERGYVAFFRSRWAENIYRSTSEDGLNWTSPEKTSLPNPNSGIGAAALPNGDIVIVFNNTSSTESMERRKGLYDDITPAEDTRVNQPGIQGETAIWGTPRRALSVGLSKDRGKNWHHRILEDGDGFCMTNNSKERSNRELSYPSIFVESGTQNQKSVHIAYTYHRQNIKYVHLQDVEAFVTQSNTSR